MRKVAWTLATLGILLSAGCPSDPPSGAAGAEDARPSLATPARAEAPEDAGALRGAMRGIVEPLQLALPLALSESRFADPANRLALAGALEQLAERTADLETHGQSREASFGFMSRWLARDASEANRRFQEGRPEEARYFLGELAQDCIGCHARLPSPGDSPLGASLFSSVDPASLDPFETIRLQLMTRQFSDAMASCERLLASMAEPPARLDVEGVLDDLLLLGVRIERDPARARRALEGFAARSDIPVHLQETVTAWSASLRDLESASPEGPVLDQARRAAERGQAKRRYPADRRGAVDDLHASSLLHRLLEGSAEPITGTDRAEAHYLLGLTELRRTESFWPSEADFYLEQAIRMAPGSPVARRAYAVLEEHTLVGYTGSGGLQLPPDVAGWLGELRALAEGA